MREVRLLSFALALGAALFISSAASAATVIQFYDLFNNKNVTVEDSPGKALPVKVTDPDRAYSVITNLGLVATPIAAGQAREAVVATSMWNYGRGTLLCSWGVAAADTDSVNVAVFISGRTSMVSANVHSFYPAVNDTVTANVNPAAAGTAVELKPTYYITRNALRILNAGPSTRQVNMQPGVFRLGASSSAIAIPIADIAGAFASFPFISIKVVNLHPRTNLSSFNADMWPRVN